MSPLDAARRLTENNGATYDAETLDDGYRTFCMLCNEWVMQHAEGCPWLAMPRIVAALEAAEAMRLELTRGSQPIRGGDPALYEVYPETVLALVATLRGADDTDGDGAPHLGPIRQGLLDLDDAVRQLWGLEALSKGCMSRNDFLWRCAGDAATL